MTALLIVLAVLILIGLIPVGALVLYREEELLVKAAIGPVQFTVYPSKPLHGRKLAKQHEKKRKKEQEAAKKKAEKKRKKVEEKKAKAEQSAPGQKPAVNQKPKKKMSLDELLPIAKLGLEVVGSLPRKLLLRELRLHALFGGADAASIAINYGRAWAAVGAAMPVLEKCFRIGRRDIGVDLDYGRETLGLDAALDIRMRVGTALGLALGAGVKFLVILVKNKAKHKNSSKGGAAA